MDISCWIEKYYSLKEFVPEEIYIGKLPRFFWDTFRYKKMGLSLKPDKENKNWKENNFNLRTLKSLATKANIKSEEADDSNTVFSDPTFTIAYAPT